MRVIVIGGGEVGRNLSAWLSGESHEVTLVDEDRGLWTLSALMLIGRLEIFTVLVLLTPAFWRHDIA